MPNYAYRCETCGEFSANRSLAEFAAPAPCPDCGAPAARALSAPHFAGTEPTRRRAEAVNERAATMPQRHAAGCGCCAPASAKARTFPGMRPRLISH